MSNKEETTSNITESQQYRFRVDCTVPCKYQSNYAIENIENIVNIVNIEMT